MYDPGTYPSLSVWWECWQPGSCPDTFNWIENAPALIGLLGLLGLLGIDDDDGGSAPAPTPNNTAVP